MSKLLNGILPQAPVEYDVSKWNQLIKLIQQALGISVHSTLDAEETEAVNFFLMN